MAHPLIEKILRDGVSSVNVSMLSPELRERLLSDAGERLLHMGRLPEAAHTFELAGNTDQLRNTAAWLLEQRRFREAALFLKPIGRSEELEELADRCVKLGDFSLARELYEEVGNEPMVTFLAQNFLKKEN